MGLQHDQTINPNPEIYGKTLLVFKRQVLDSARDAFGDFAVWAGYTR